MKRSYPENLLAMLEAEDKLIARGYVRIDCKECRGRGYAKSLGLIKKRCFVCDGRQYIFWPKELT